MEYKSQIQIPKVKLGSQGLEVSRLGFGCGGLSGIYNAPLSHEAGCSVIKEAFNRGITFFDTSDLYGENHDNEILVGKALKQLPREKVQLATKFGIVRSEGIEFGINGNPEYVRACCEASLKRLDVDYIDLYYQHRVDVSVPIEDTIGELKKLVNEGKIRYIGLSEASIDTIMRAHAVHPITAVQMEYSLWTREIENEIIPLCRKLGIGIVSYSPLGRGFFGGKAILESLPAESLLSIHPRFNGENLEKNKLFYNKLANLAAKHSCNAPQLALAWLLHQGKDIIPIPDVKQENDEIFISQKKYMREILEKFKMESCNAANTLNATGLKLSKGGEGKLVNSTPYGSLVGGLKYLTITRPDILYGVGLVSRYLETPR